MIFLPVSFTHFLQGNLNLISSIFSFCACVISTHIYEKTLGWNKYGVQARSGCWRDAHILTHGICVNDKIWWLPSRFSASFLSSAGVKYCRILIFNRRQNTNAIIKSSHHAQIVTSNSEWKFGCSSFSFPPPTNLHLSLYPSWGRKIVEDEEEIPSSFLHRKHNSSGLAFQLHSYYYVHIFLSGRLSPPKISPPSSSSRIL